MSMIQRNETKPKLKAVIFDRWTVERVSGSRASPLISIYEGLVQRGGFIQIYHDPSAFIPEQDEIPMYMKGPDKGREPFKPNVVFTYGFNFLHIQEYYSEPKHRADIVTVDFGFLRRDLGYRYVMKNGKLPKTSSHARFKQLGLAIEDRRKQDGHILVCMQNHNPEWYSKALALVYDNVNQEREVRIRQDTRESGFAKPLEEDLDGAYALVTYDSTCLFNALLWKIPVFCSEECIAAEIAEIDFTKIENVDLPSPQKLQNFLNRLAYSQWRIDELKTGIWVPHYFEGY